MSSIHTFAYDLEEFDLDGVYLNPEHSLTLTLSIETDHFDGLSPVRLECADVNDGGVRSFMRPRKALPVWLSEALEAYVRAEQPKLTQAFLDRAELHAVSKVEAFT